MSGHNKWSKIHRQKSAADNKRGTVFTKLGKAITIAAKTGGGDADTNFKLKLAIEQAKASNMPKDNIERAVKRGTGELEGGIIEEITYEGYGPQGTAFMVEALTDNRNRTSSAMKHTFSKYGGSLGGPNSVAWMFEQKGIIRIEQENLDEELQLSLIDIGLEDTVSEENGLTLYVSPEKLEAIQKLLNGRGINVTYSEVEYVPKEKRAVTDGDAEKIKKMIDEFDDNEDVNNVHTNATF